VAVHGKKFCDSSLRCVDTIPECDKQTDGRTLRQWLRHAKHYYMLSRVKIIKDVQMLTSSVDN